MWLKHLLDVGFSVCFRVMILNFVNVTLKHTTCNSQDLNPLWNSMLKSNPTVLQQLSIWSQLPKTSPRHPGAAVGNAGHVSSWTLQPERKKLEMTPNDVALERCSTNIAGANANIAEVPRRSRRSVLCGSVRCVSRSSCEIKWGEAINGVSWEFGIWKTPLHLWWPTQTRQSHEYIWPRSKCSKTSTNSHPHTRTYTSVDSVGRSTKRYQDQIWQNQMQQWGYQLVDEQTHGATWMNEISEWSALRQTVGTLVAEFL